MGIDTMTQAARHEDRFDMPHQQAEYRVAWTRGAANDPELAKRAQQLHGLSYVEYKYFTPDALAEDGRLLPELDGTREREGLDIDITYLLALPLDSNHVADAKATIRLGDISEEGSIEDLPTYKYFKDSMTLSVRDRLEGLVGEYGPEALREVMALASEGHEGHKAAYELMRAVIQNDIIKQDSTGQNKLYITALTDKSLQPVWAFAGKYASQIIGEPVRIFSQDSRAASDLRVTPVLIDPHKIIGGIVREIEECDTSSRGTRREQMLSAKLHFLTDGLTVDQMGDSAARYLASRPVT